MEISVRKAEQRDIDKILELLGQVLEIHAKIRPDIFISGTTKYTKEQLSEILTNEKTPVFVAVNENNEVMGYAFCVIKAPAFSTTMRDFSTLYIDDLCVDEAARGNNIGGVLFEYVKRFAKETGCYEVTLAVWEGNNSARKFYEKMGMTVKETIMQTLP